LLPPLPKGEALAISRKVTENRQRLPLWGSWREAPERARTLTERVGLVTEGPQGEEKVLVTAVAGHDLIRLQAKVHRRRFQQVGAGGVGVETELFHLVLAHRRHHRRAGQIGALVGVQLDVLLVLRLLPWGVGGDCFKFRREIFTHSNFLTVSVLAHSRVVARYVRTYDYVSYVRRYVRTYDYVLRRTWRSVEDETTRRTDDAVTSVFYYYLLLLLLLLLLGRSRTAVRAVA